MEDFNLNQAEHEHISAALEVEKLEVNLFRSKSLFVPVRARGVFGGQVISQALVSASNCVDPAFGLHSLHCYFLLSASPATPIVYNVERLRQGRSYVTCSIKAVQQGKIIFVMICSFQKPEPWQPAQSWKMPNVPPPEECILEEERYAKMYRNEGLSAHARETLLEFAKDRARSPIAVKTVRHQESLPDRTTRCIYWMQAKNIPKHEPQFQKCILSYLSDLYFVGTAASTLGLNKSGKGLHSRGMMSTIDHAIYFYEDDFDCGDWVLYVMTSPRAGSGRGIVQGQIYSRQGKLIAITSQEGVVRANIRGPGDKATTTAKL